jgi:hypothetical protein
VKRLPLVVRQEIAYASADGFECLLEVGII